MPPFHLIKTDSSNGFIYYRGFWFAIYKGNVYRAIVIDGQLTRDPNGHVLLESASGSDRHLHSTVQREWVTRLK